MASAELMSISSRSGRSKEVGGRQVAYNGHFLYTVYTFAGDSPGVSRDRCQRLLRDAPNIRAMGSSTTARLLPHR